MTLKEINEEYENLKQVEKHLKFAIKKFEGTKDVENYLDYDILCKAIDCVILAINNFENKEWQ